MRRASSEADDGRQDGVCLRCATRRSHGYTVAGAAACSATTPLEQANHAETDRGVCTSGKQSPGDSLPSADEAPVLSVAANSFDEHERRTQFERTHCEERQREGGSGSDERGIGKEKHCDADGADDRKASERTQRRLTREKQDGEAARRARHEHGCDRAAVHQPAAGMRRRGIGWWRWRRRWTASR